MSLLKIKPFSIDLTETFTFANANITANLLTGNANLGNLATANFFSGNGNALFSIQGANVTGQVANALVAGTVYTNAQPNITSVGSLSGLVVSNATGIVDFTTTANVTLGSVANLHIAGGTNGQLLKTNGSGVLEWFTPAAGVTGSNTQVQFNDAGSAGASANLTFDKTTNTLSVTNIIANGSGLTSLTGANVTGFVANANVANTAFAVAGANVSGFVANANVANTAFAVAGANVSGFVANANVANTAFAVAGANVSGAVSFATTANAVAGANVSGAVAFATTANAVAGANVSGQVANALVAGTVYTNAQPNITSVGTLTSLDVTGNIASGNANLGNLAIANFFSGNGNALFSIQGANVSGFVANANVANTAFAVAGANVSGQVANANVAYFESVTTQTTGTFYPVFVSGNANGNYALASNTALSFNAATGVLTTGTIQSGGGSGGNITGANLISANFFSGSGNLLSNIQGANVSGAVSYATTANAVAGANVSGQVANALVAGTVYTNAQPNITSVGTLSSLSVTGDIGAANLTLTGNLIISGTTTSVNSTVTRVVDPLFELGGGANGATLTSDDNKDRGLLLHYYSGSSAIDAFMGWDDSNVEFGVGSNVTITNEVVTFNSYGNIRAGYFLGNGSQLTGVSASSSLNIVNGTSNVDIATTNGNVTVGVAGNAAIVTVTGTGVNIAGYANLGSGNLLTTGNVTAGYVIGNGSSLTSITGANVTGAVTFAGTANAVAGANVSGQVANALVSGTVYTNAQPNITSVGTLTSLDVTGNISSGNANLGNAVTANFFIGSGANLSSLAGANVSGQVANALVAGTVYTNAQPNITSVGSLANLTVTGNVALSGANVTLGAVGNLHITGGSANYYLKTDGSGTLSWESVPITTLNVDTYTGDGSFTMKTLTVTPANANFTLVAIGGVFQPRDAYSIAGAVITFDDPPPNGAIVEVTTVVAGAAGAGGGGASVLDDLTDVTITSPANNQVLKYNGASWVNGAGAASWTYSAVSANTSAVAGYRYIVDTATANLTITLPASGTLGDEIMIIDGTGNSSTHAITVDRNGGKIQGAASNMTVTTDRAAFTLVYYNNTQGWLLTNV